MYVALFLALTSFVSNAQSSVCVAVPWVLAITAGAFHSDRELLRASGFAIALLLLHPHPAMVPCSVASLLCCMQGSMGYPGAFAMALYFYLGCNCTASADHQIVAIMWAECVRLACDAFLYCVGTEIFY